VSAPSQMALSTIARAAGAPAAASPGPQPRAKRTGRRSRAPHQASSSRPCSGSGAPRRARCARRRAAVVREARRKAALVRQSAAEAVRRAQQRLEEPRRRRVSASAGCRCRRLRVPVSVPVSGRPGASAGGRCGCRCRCRCRRWRGAGVGVGVRAEPERQAAHPPPGISLGGGGLYAGWMRGGRGLYKQCTRTRWTVRVGLYWLPDCTSNGALVSALPAPSSSACGVRPSADARPSRRRGHVHDHLVVGVAAAVPPPGLDDGGLGPPPLPLVLLLPLVPRRTGRPAPDPVPPR
jgi:hypothetical protein